MTPQPSFHLDMLPEKQQIPGDRLAGISQRRPSQGSNSLTDLVGNLLFPAINEQIELAMQSIQQATTQSVASTRQPERTAQDLHTLAQSLQGAIAVYQL